MKNHLFLFVLLQFSCLPIIAQKLHKSCNVGGFIENRGQIVDQKGKPNRNVLYLLPTSGLNVQLRQTGFSYDLFEVTNQPLKKSADKDLPWNVSQTKFKYKVHRLDFNFINTSSRLKVIAENKLNSYNNYYTVAHSEEGITNVYKFQKVIYKDIYKDIDIEFIVPTDSTKLVEYNFIIHPGGNIDDIKFEIKGAETSLVKEGIKIKVKFGDLLETIPLSWSHDEGATDTINIDFKNYGGNVYGFTSKRLVSKRKTIVIDPVPVRLWGTYAGGEIGAVSSVITTDLNDNIYVTGNTGSHTNVATAGTHISTYSSLNQGFISKYNPEGQLLWGTYYAVTPTEIVVDSNNNVIFSGGVFYDAPNIASVDAYQPIKSTYKDAFVVKLNSAGIREWGTYYGSTENEDCYALTVDNAGNIYFGGGTFSSTLIATPGSHLEVYNTPNFELGYFVKFSPQGQRLWATYYPGTLFCAQISQEGYLFVTGSTQATQGIATPGAYQQTLNGSGDGFIAKFALDGVRVWGTYIGGSGGDQLLRGKLKGENLYLQGRTFSHSGLATPNTFLTTYPETAIIKSYIINFNVATQQKVWGTYFFEQIIGLDVNANQDVYFSGYTSISTGLTTPDAYMPERGPHQKSYLVKLNSSGQRVWGTYYGGNKAEQLGFLALDTAGDIYLYGTTNGSTTGLTTPNAHQEVKGSALMNTFLVKFRDCLSATSVTGTTQVCQGGTIQLNAQGGENYSWTGPNNFISNQQNITIPNATSAATGTYFCTITGSAGCDNTLSIDARVEDTTPPVPNISDLPAITGTCNLTVINFPTATDACSGQVTATTTSSLSFNATGNYIISWSYIDSSGNTTTQQQNVIVNPDPSISVNQSLTVSICNSSTLDLYSITNQLTSANATYTFYATLNDANTNSNAITSPNSYPVINNHTIYARVALINGCIVISAVTLNIAPLPLVNNAVLSTCSANQIGVFNLNDAQSFINSTPENTFTYYASMNDLQNNLEILNISSYSTTANHQILYVKVMNSSGCYSIVELMLNINNINELSIPDQFACREAPNSVILDLSSRLSDIFSLVPAGNYSVSYHDNYTDAIVGNNPISTQAEIVTGSKVIYYRLTSLNTCPYLIKFKIIAADNPTVIVADKYYKCKDEPIVINLNNPEYNYVWSTGNTTPTETIGTGGDYWVRAEKNYGGTVCQSIYYFSVVEYSSPQISDVIINDWTENSNSLTINTVDIDAYEYSLDGTHFQSSNIFTNLPSGIFDIYVRSLNCGIAIAKASLLMYPKFFTPNNDGVNDSWKIDFSFFEPDLQLIIYDRYGKLLYKGKGTAFGWDGTYQNELLPATDYWFTVIRQNGRIYRGHFSLIR